MSCAHVRTCRHPAGAGTARCLRRPHRQQCKTQLSKRAITCSAGCVHIAGADAVGVAAYATPAAAAATEAGAPLGATRWASFVDRSVACTCCRAAEAATLGTGSAAAIRMGLMRLHGASMSGSCIKLLTGEPLGRPPASTSISVCSHSENKTRPTAGTRVSAYTWHTTYSWHTTQSESVTIRHREGNSAIAAHATSSVDRLGNATHHATRLAEGQPLAR